jgi:hypothetical protein
MSQLVVYIISWISSFLCCCKEVALSLCPLFQIQSLFDVIAIFIVYFVNVFCKFLMEPFMHDLILFVMCGLIRRLVLHIYILYLGFLY